MDDEYTMETLLPELGEEIQTPVIGEYVLCTKWVDRDPYDPWTIGFLCDFGEYPPHEFCRYPAKYFLVEGNSRAYGHAWKITPEQGKRVLDTYAGIT